MLDGDHNFYIVMSYKPLPVGYIFMLIRSDSSLQLEQRKRERGRKYLDFVRFI